MLKRMSTASLLLMASISNIYAADPLIFSLNLIQQNSKFSLPGAENKSKGYSSIATLSKEIYDGWYGTAILGYSDIKVDANLNSTSQDVDVNTYGLAASKTFGLGLSANVLATYGKSATDSNMILSGTRTSYSNSADSLVLSAGLNQIVRYTANDYTSVGISVTNVSSSTDAYLLNATRIEKSDNDYSYVTLNVKQTWVIDGYKPSIGLQYTRVNQNYSQTSDRDYFRLGADVKKEIIKDLTLGLSYSTIQGQDYNSNNTFGLNITKKF